MPNIHFTFHGTGHNAVLERDENNRLVVSLKNDTLQNQFGTSLPFFVQNKRVGFDILNKCHSDLYELNSTISKAIAEQCEELL